MKKMNRCLFALLIFCAMLPLGAAAQVVNCNTNEPPQQGSNLCKGSLTVCTNTGTVITITNPNVVPPSPANYDVLVRYTNDDPPPVDCNEFLFTNRSVTAGAGAVTINIPAGNLPDGILDGAFKVWVNIKQTGNATWQYFYHRINGACAMVLPLTLVSFDARNITGNKTELKWTTASESMTSHFEIQASMNGCIFQTVGQVPAAGNSSGNLNYTYIHNSPYRIDASKDATQYRLKMVDLDGRFTYSLIRLVRCNTCPQPPAQPCTSQSIQGPAGLCTSTAQQFTIANANYTTFTTWSANPAASVSVVGNACYANVTRNTTSGSVTLSAQVLGCASPLTKALSLGNAPFYLNTTQYNDACGNYLNYTVSVVYYAGTSSSQYSWYRNNVYDGTGYSRTYYLSPGQSVSYKVVYNGPCGQQLSSGYASNGGINPVKYNVSPVPANSEIQLHRPPPCAEPALPRQAKLQVAEPVTYELYDWMGNLKKRVKATAGVKTQSVSVRDLPEGNYVLRISEGAYTETHHIKIVH